MSRDLFFFSLHATIKSRADKSRAQLCFAGSSSHAARLGTFLPLHKPNVRKYYKALPAAFQLRMWKWCGLCVLAERARSRVCTAIEPSCVFI
jgi:hypothetical protein